MRKLFSAISMMALSGILFPGGATSVQYSYADVTTPVKGLGTGHADTYDVAVLLEGRLFAGATVKALEVPVIPEEYLSATSVWLSRSLNLEHNQNAPDLFQAEVEARDGWLRYVFAEPLTVPEEGLYAGYSFKVDRMAGDDTADPVLTAGGMTEGGLFVHAGTIFRKWTDLAPARHMVSRLTVTLEGDFPQADMKALFHEEDINVLHSADEIEFPLWFRNYGGTPQEDLRLDYRVGEREGSVRIDVASSLPDLFYMQDREIPVRIPNGLPEGEHVISVWISEVDGRRNASSSDVVEEPLFVLPYFPEHRPLLEEYTGLWCNYCPRGFAMLEYMDRVYPETFVGMSYHHDDAMEVMAVSEFPNPVPTYPYAWMDRCLDLDPYYGTDASLTLEADWKERRKDFTPFDIDAAPVWDEETGTLRATVRSEVVKPLAGEYRIDCCLLADGLASSSWIQANGYAGEDPDLYSIPEMRRFCEGERRMKGLVFNDVVIARDDAGSAGEIVDPVPGEPYIHEFRFSPREIVSTDGTKLGEMTDRFAVVAIVADAESGKVLNSVKRRINLSDTADPCLETEKTEIDIEYFDLLGRRLAVPSQSAFVIKRVRFADGSVTTNLHHTH